jgi:hypothetical protein
VLILNGVHACLKKLFLEAGFFKTERPLVFEPFAEDPPSGPTASTEDALAAVPPLLGAFFNFDLTLPPSDNGSVAPSLNGTGGKPKAAEKIEE